MEGAGHLVRTLAVKPFWGLVVGARSARHSAWGGRGTVAAAGPGIRPGPGLALAAGP